MRGFFVFFVKLICLGILGGSIPITFAGDVPGKPLGQIVGAAGAGLVTLTCTGNGASTVQSCFNETAISQTDPWEMTFTCNGHGIQCGPNLHHIGDYGCCDVVTAGCNESLTYAQTYAAICTALAQPGFAGPITMVGTTG